MAKSPKQTERLGHSVYNSLMDRTRLYRLLQPGNAEPGAWIWRAVQHTMAAAGIGLMLVLTVADWREAHGDLLTDGFDFVAAFFVLEYLVRLYAAPGAPGGQHRGAWRARLAWAVSLGGVFDLLAAAPSPG